MEKYFKPKKENFTYFDKHFNGTEQEYYDKLDNSTILYVGEVNLTVKEERLWELFSLTGEIKRVIMGINNKDKMPCGFCFIEYYKREDAQNAINLFNQFRLDNKHLRVSFDYGFVDGREKGRGVRGGQIKDDNKFTKKIRTNEN
ncbi:Nuclear cap-binding protein subunit 2 [Binucleata daphniae]